MTRVATEATGTIAVRGIGPAALAVLLVAALATGLIVDIRFDLPGQIAASVAVWAIILWMLARTGTADRVALLACLAWSTAGELFLSLVWGLYEYQFGNVPLFVPPGHAMLFTLGTLAARHVPERAWMYVVLLVGPWALVGTWHGIDTLGGLLFAVFVLCLASGGERRLYVAMFLLSAALEIYGTALGNWRWLPREDVLGLTTTNPPVSASTFYCLLDFLIVLTVRRVCRTTRLADLPADARWSGS